MDKHGLRAVMLHEFKLGHSAAEATRNINRAWGPDSAVERTVRNWFKRFASGNLNLHDETGRGRKSLVDNEQLKAAIEANPEATTRTLAIDLGVHPATVARHLNRVGKVKSKQRWVPRDLTNDQ